MTLSLWMSEAQKMTDEKPITLEAAVQQVVAELAGPTPVAEVVQRVLTIHQSKRPALYNLKGEQPHRTTVLPCHSRIGGLNAEASDLLCPVSQWHL
jgi:hypothetical protein